MLAVSLRSETEPPAFMGARSDSAARELGVEPAHLLIVIEPHTASLRGKLAEFVDECIERELDCQGAPPADPEICGELEARLRDQQYRARLLGYHGMTLTFANLDAIAERAVLDAADSQVLRIWLEREDSSLHVRVGDSILRLNAYPRPVPVWEWLAGRATPNSATIPVPESNREIQASEPLSTVLPPELEAAPTIVPSTLPSDFEFEADEECAAPRQNAVSAVNLREVALSEPAPSASAEPACREPEHAAIWREALERSDGTQSWENLERLYVGNYLPLSHLASDGRASAATQARLVEWARDFERCYLSAFARLRSGGARPNMVLDVPQLSFSLMRELEATQIRLILVDGMRFDLGQRVHDKLRLQLLGHANCVQRRVLWAALPATTAVQLELLARSACALGKTLGDLDERAWLAKGAEARKLRALRVGPHQVRKLDILEAEFSRTEWLPSELERAAAEVAVSTGRFIRAQSPGTLVVVFGDHGLADARSVGHAAPEQVLVPYDAWLVHDSANN